MPSVYKRNAYDRFIFYQQMVTWLTPCIILQMYCNKIIQLHFCIGLIILKKCYVHPFLCSYTCSYRCIYIHICKYMTWEGKVRCSMRGWWLVWVVAREGKWERLGVHMVDVGKVWAGIVLEEERRWVDPMWLKRV